MAHDLSLSSARFDHMSPTAMALAAMLHAVVAIALLATPFREARDALDAIEITIEQEPAKPPPPVQAQPQPQPQPPPPPPPAASVPQPAPAPPPVAKAEPALQQQLGLSAPIGTTMDPRAPLVAPNVGAAEPEPSAHAPAGQDPTQLEEAKEEPKPAPPEEVVKVDPGSETATAEPVQDQQVAALAPPPAPPAPPPPQLEDALATQPPAPVLPPPTLADTVPLRPPPPAPPAPRLEDALPALDAPPPPITSREVPAAPPAPPKPQPPPAAVAKPQAPSPPVAKPQPPPAPAPPVPAPPVQAQPAPRPAAPKPQAPPPPAPQPAVPHQQLARSPLSRPTQPQRHGSGDTRQASRAPPSTFVNPADIYGQRRVEEDYRWSIVRQLSQRRVYSRTTSEEGKVVVLVTIARDGRLLGASINRSSGYRSLDNAALEALRASAPYPPLPADIGGDRHSFVVPLNYRRNDM